MNPKTTQPNDSAFPDNSSRGSPGITKYEYFLGEILKGLLASGHFTVTSEPHEDISAVIRGDHGKDWKTEFNPMRREPTVIEEALRLTDDLFTIKTFNEEEV